jgi:hypothetical protein
MFNIYTLNYLCLYSFFFTYDYLAFTGDDASFRKNQLKIYLEELRSVDLDESFDILSF